MSQELKNPQTFGGGGTTYLTSDGVRLAASLWGVASGPAVVLLHGGGQTRHAWGSTGQELGRKGYLALSVDLRGHGDSDWHEDGDYSAEALTGDLRRIGELVGRPIAVVGASAGGITALLAAGRRELQTWAVVLVDVVPRLESEGANRILEFMTARPDGFASLEEAAESISSYLPHRPKRPDLTGLQKNLRRDPAGRYRWHWDPRFLDHGRSIRETQCRLEVAARGLGVPTLLVRGSHSEVVSEQGVAEFLSLAPHAKVVEVPGARHMVAGDENDAFASAVIEFLDSCRPDRSS